MAALIDRDTRRHLKQPRHVTLLGEGLASAKEEAFCIMVMDGLAIGIAFAKAGFKSTATNAPYALFHKPHIQARASAILEARRTQGVVTLPEVTSMLKRVFAGALHDAEYSAAHNAAFSLARIYGHVTDRATLEVIRRPSRDPDAPSEQALGAWVEALPGLASPDHASFLRVSDAPSTPLEHASQGPGPLPSDIKGLEGPGLVDWYANTAGPGPLDGELSNDIKGLGPSGSGVGGRPENGSPARPVTGTPDGGAHSELLGPEPLPPEGGIGGGEKGAPLQHGQVPATTGVNIPNLGNIPSAEELFG